MKKAASIFILLAFLFTAVPCNALITESETASVVGDINGDGVVNAMDSYFLKMVVVGSHRVDNPLVADITLDGSVDSRDSYLMKTGLAGVSGDFVKKSGKNVDKILIAGSDISKYQIFVPEDATDNVEFSAKELQKYIERACGAYLPIAENRGSTPLFIYSLDTTGELGDEGVDICVEDGNVYITGGTKRGCMYATYEFLERYIGYVFINDKSEYVYKNQIVNIADGANFRYVPSIVDRGSRTASAESATAAVKWKNSSTKCSSGIAASKYGGGIETGSVHTIGDYTYCPNDAYICYTNAAIRTEVIEGVFEKIENTKEKGREIERVIVGPMDNPGCCACRNCNKITKAEGSYMGAQLTFVNVIAEAVAEKYSDVNIMTTAYWLARKPPKTVEPLENIEIMYCWAGCNNHLFDGSQCYEEGNGYWSNNIRDSEWLTKWTELSDRVWVWLYCGSYSWSFAQPSMLDYMRENLSFLADKGIYGIYCEGEYGYPEAFGDGYSFDLLTMYMFSRCTWDPHMTEEEFDAYVDEFLYYYYGKGYEQIRRYLHINEAATDAIDACWCNNYDIPFDALDFDYLKEHSEEMIELLDTALSMCETESELENTERLAACVYWQALAVTYESDFENGTEEERSLYTQRYKKMHAWMAEHEMVYRVTVPETDEVCDPYSWTGWKTYHKPREPKDPMAYV
ncbi:MAG: DUF4838 domain-containing protein [Clostridia bacterium]|nr:DUF4838 domain-containing protein [Clostridia bacterium]